VSAFNTLFLLCIQCVYVPNCPCTYYKSCTPLVHCRSTALHAEQRCIQQTHCSYNNLDVKLVRDLHIRVVCLLSSRATDQRAYAAQHLYSTLPEARHSDVQGCAVSDLPCVEHWTSRPITNCLSIYTTSAQLLVCIVLWPHSAEVIECLAVCVLLDAISCNSLLLASAIAKWAQ
jgi:hypothetical protein